MAVHKLNEDITEEMGIPDINTVIKSNKING